MGTITQEEILKRYPWLNKNTVTQVPLRQDLVQLQPPMINQMNPIQTPDDIRTHRHWLYKYPYKPLNKPDDMITPPITPETIPTRPVPETIPTRPVPETIPTRPVPETIPIRPVQTPGDLIEQRPWLYRYPYKPQPVQTFGESLPQKEPEPPQVKKINYTIYNLNPNMSAEDVKRAIITAGLPDWFNIKVVNTGPDYLKYVNTMGTDPSDTQVWGKDPFSMTIVSKDDKRFGYRNFSSAGGGYGTLSGWTDLTNRSNVQVMSYDDDMSIGMRIKHEMLHTLDLPVDDLLTSQKEKFQSWMNNTNYVFKDFYNNNDKYNNWWGERRNVENKFYDWMINENRTNIENRANTVFYRKRKTGGKKYKTSKKRKGVKKSDVFGTLVGSLSKKQKRGKQYNFLNSML